MKLFDDLFTTTLPKGASLVGVNSKETLLISETFEHPLTVAHENAGNKDNSTTFLYMNHKRSDN
jgi:hypothetical protein